MFKTIIFSALFSLYILVINGQSSNPLYWKNRTPVPGYWQQDVSYKINAFIDDKTDIITGEEHLTYTNNSPDKLAFVYFHLYQNAFQPGSYCHNLHEINQFDIQYGKYEKEKKGTEVIKVHVNGQVVKTELDNTILKVFLSQTLNPGESIDFDIDFKTYFDSGSIRRRMKMFKSYGYKHYDGVHWYPRISVYDRKMGWDTDQHLTREFYGDFGTFDVELTFANHFIVDATGVLINKEEVLPNDLREKLDLKNFKDKPWGEKPSVIIPYDSSIKKTWKFHAENVHDFAFTADPTYRIGESIWNDVSCIALAQEPHASGWQNAAEYTAQIIKTFSEEIGMYCYPKMIVADAKDGMEYPMLTLDGGSDPGYRDLLVHEVGHNWFYGQVGTNETYRAFLDEGFTQYLTSLGLEKIDGKTLVEDLDKNKYKRAFRKEKLVREDEVYVPYLMDALREQDAPLNTHSDQFGNALRHGGGYRQVYMKTATMLYNLEYVLGDDLFKKAMQHYFEQWKMAHPYPEDFRNSIIQYTNVDLNWFFDQWLETTKTIDYGIKKIKKTAPDEYSISFRRNSEMQMPLDFQVISKEGKKYNFHIPNTWFEKNTTATTLPRWIGWGKLNDTYHAKIQIPSGIHSVLIDTSMRLADVNRLNNKTCQKIDWSFDHKIKNLPNIHRYETFLRPEVWYNALDGIKTGIHLNGNYLKHKHIFDFTAWYNTGIGASSINLFGLYTKDRNLFSYRAIYQNSAQKLIKKSYYKLQSKYLDGLIGNSFSYHIPSRSDKGLISLEFKSMFRERFTDLIYLINPLDWNNQAWNNQIKIQYAHTYRYVHGSGSVLSGISTSALTRDYNYSYWFLESKNQTKLKKLLFSTRFYAQFGQGNSWAPESKLYLAQANPEEMMENKFTRSAMVVNDQETFYSIGQNHLHYGGGLNLRGYTGFIIQKLNNYSSYSIRNSSSGASINLEVEIQQLFPWNTPKISKYIDLKLYPFTDAGIIQIDPLRKTTFSNLLIDAGIGTALTLKQFGPLENIKPLTLRADFPLFLNQVSTTDSNIDFRWIIGISRAF